MILLPDTYFLQASDFIPLNLVFLEEVRIFSQKYGFLKKSEYSPECLFFFPKSDISPEFELLTKQPTSYRDFFRTAQVVETRFTPVA